MAPYQQRIVDEKVSLDQNIRKLELFIEEHPTFPSLSVNERTDLREQLYFMQRYSASLARRIARFKPIV